MLVEHIIRYLNEQGKQRPVDGTLRCSAAGKCARALAYQYHNYPTIPLKARALSVFRLGALVEADLVDLAVKCVPGFSAGKEYIIQKGGKAFIAYEQLPVTITINNTPIQGYVDGIVTYPNTDRIKAIVDFKSTTSYGFKRAERGDVDYGYLCQAHCYMKGLNCQDFVFLYYWKDSSAMIEVHVKWSDKIWKDVVNRFTSVLTSTKLRLPPREYGKDKSGKLPWQCSYCGFVTTCWPNVKLDFDKYGKPVLRPGDK